MNKIFIVMRSRHGTNGACVSFPLFSFNTEEKAKTVARELDKDAPTASHYVRAIDHETNLFQRERYAGALQVLTNKVSVLG